MFQDLTKGGYLVVTFTSRFEPSLTVPISLFTSPGYWGKYIRCYIIQTDSFVVTTREISVLSYKLGQSTIETSQMGLCLIPIF